jgi:hypothetical protein
LLVTSGLAKPEPKFLHHLFDPESRYAWPYGWTWLGGAFSPVTPALPATNTTAASAPILSWRDLDRLSALTVVEPREPALQEAAKRLVPAAVPVAKAGAPSGTLTLDNLSYLKTTLPQATFLPPPIIPMATLYHWVLLKDSSRMEAAGEFLKLTCSPENTAKLAASNFLSVTQKAALPFLPPEQSGDASLYPKESVLDHVEFAPRE